MRESPDPHKGLEPIGIRLQSVEDYTTLKACVILRGKDIEAMFQDHPDVPGLIIEDEEGNLLGSVSRLRFMALLSMAFGRELYLNRKLRYILKKNEGLMGQDIFDREESLDETINRALRRPSAQRFDPIVVVDKRKGPRLLSMVSVLNQHLIHTKELNQMLIKANEDKDEMLGIASHDLKNPLGVISSMAELLKEDGLDEATRREFYQGIHANSVRMLEIITSFIDASRMERDVMSPSFKWIRVRPQMEACVQAHLQAARQKGQTLMVSLDFDGDLELFTDFDQWNSVMDNLLSNAIKYTPKCGLIELSVFCSKRFFNFWVKDKEPGISQQDQKKMFGKFVRLSAKPTGDEGSTGLGLYSVKKILDALGGSIALESSPGHGSTFKARIPLEGKRD